MDPRTVDTFLKGVALLEERGALKGATQEQLRAAFNEVRASQMKPEERNAATRAAVLKAAEFRLAPSQAKSPSAAKPSINPVQSGRQDADDLQPYKYPDRLRGESDASYALRLKAKAGRRVAQLGQRADQSAKGLDVSTDPVLGMNERSEAGNAARRQALLNDHRAVDAKRASMAETRKAARTADTGQVRNATVAVMHKHGWSTDPKSAGFSEHWKRALKEANSK